MNRDGDIFDSYGNSLRNLKQSFQDGVNALRNKCISCGVTPSDSTPTGVSNAIQTIYNNRYNEGYNTGQSTYTPKILEGTCNATRNATSYSLNVQIPAGLTYVCASITGVQDASGYDDSANWKLWSVSTSWSYNSGNGIVSFNIGVGGGTYIGSNAKISYKIMYVG